MMEEKNESAESPLWLERLVCVVGSLEKRGETLSLYYLASGDINELEVIDNN
jgi:hypothetical protein